MGFRIYTSTIEVCDPQFACVGAALADVPLGAVCGVVCCGVSDEMEYHAQLSNLKSAVAKLLGRRVPVTLIPQPLLPKGGFALEIYALDHSSEPKIEERDGVCYGRVDSDEESLLFVEGIAASDFSESVSCQSEEVFARLDGVLSANGFEVDDIVRQWNYIGNIVACRDGKQNYQEFNDARTRYYAKGGWRNGYPAATGIGAVGEGIVVGAIAYRSVRGGVYPIDNPLQVAAHIYSKSVLIDEAVDAVKSTPKFERAKLIERADGACCFVSGTAAIRGEESVDRSSARLQTIKTIENIEYLVSKENLVRFGCKAYDLRCAKLQVFIKRAEDYDCVRSVVEQAYPQVATVYTIADVCRSELLVEIEGILIS